MSEPAAEMPETMAVVGCGVIGAAWASRMALSGIDVRVADPTPHAQNTLDAVLTNAVLAWDELGFPSDRQGSITIVGSIAEAVTDVAFIQESVPERLEVKAAVFAEIEAATEAESVIASSTSGLKPTAMQASLKHPERLVVGHPFNPVYLLPLVEVVGGEQTTIGTIHRAEAIYTGLGMHPLHVRVEIDAFIADRLLEAVWREALCLVNDGIATTAEIDTAITYGFGLRWAQMGLFETYRIAGGAGGFGHFIEQFAPTLDWPWSKLTDTPELTPELVDLMVQQSDKQSGMHSPSELEQIRDRNIVGFLKVLEENRWAAGNTIAEERKRYNGPGPVS